MADRARTGRGRRVLGIVLILCGTWLAVALYREEAGQALIDAIWKDDAPRAKALLARGADPNVRRDRKDRFRGC